jgi:hypothetical protein
LNNLVRFHSKVESILRNLDFISSKMVIKVSKSILNIIISEINSINEIFSDRRPSFIQSEPSIRPRLRFNSMNILVLKDRNSIPKIFKEMKLEITPAKSLASIPKEAKVILRNLKRKGTIRYFDKPQKSKKYFVNSKKSQGFRKFSLNSDIQKSQKLNQKRQKPTNELSGFIENKGNIFGSVSKIAKSSTNKNLNDMELDNAILNFSRKGSTVLMKSNQKTMRKYSEITERTPHFGYSYSDKKKQKKKRKQRKRKKKKNQIKTKVKENKEEIKESSEEDEEYYQEHLLKMCRK